MDANERRARASAEAAEWWAKLQSDDKSPQQRAEFVDWLRESAVHVAELLRVARVHAALEQLQRWERIGTDGSGEDDNVVALPAAAACATAQPLPRPLASGEIRTGKGGDGHCSARVRGRIARGRHWAIAAGVCLIVIATIWFARWSPGQIIQTELGERREVSLADGSIVQVDPETRLRVKFDDQVRDVSLERGRALFRVAKNPSRPFLVHANGTLVRALGTAFGVERQRQSVVVTVAEGKVAVFPMHSLSTPGAAPSIPFSPAAESAANRGGAALMASRPSAPPAPQTAELLLTADQQVLVRLSGSAEPVRKVDSGRELAWAEGWLVFDNDTVAAVIDQFNRYNRVQLHVTDKTLAGRRVSAVFNSSDPESFIAFIQGVTAVRLVRGAGGDITLAPNVNSPEIATQK